MRGLKFRAWNTGTKEWSTTLKLKSNGHLEDLDFDSEGVYRFEPEPDQYVVEQYTGLKDKNGKEIYEGDIVTFMVEVFDSVTLGFDNEEWHTAVVEWNQDDACYSFVDGDDPFSVRFGAEVIGNIHENGDLLNVD